jgi:hypothetical protein
MFHSVKGLAAELNVPLRFIERWGYICWTESGRSRERSTGTSDRQEAEERLGEFLLARNRQSGPRDPDETLVSTILADYAEMHADTPGFNRIAYAVRALVPWWQERAVGDVNEATCRQYVKWRGAAPRAGGAPRGRQQRGQGQPSDASR